ncbi:HD-like signal output (HDOD) protein [Clostridium tetanomorphum]|uniref:Stage 0 sporulation protein A homolog n=1 Tax=Clostridium tetanomorphum TaxID=1553 RepID=A0A923E627_CLOTT|nr:HDOD domain-containing protein [Clostridium tetanomorphum]KAJ50906.1 putative signal transduction protein [Clostridium tetanomorphum DSM 665]MBC2397157.1 HDOD domain-containing protein [Clostridium tetanomorphum]MBP1863079.1 HD-like signal output (HDOD) protein [Clostridium tetanomorphum]NRS82908.1 HD-like signal output (HDOD) protein [Clostridium tetanomorphum]NRZ98996.1 HD-like signal output (HDOD) protein [Clostridium tetanomorphum]
MKKSILFVDDEKQILNSLRRVFMGSNYTTYFVLSGEEALNILSKNHIDLIITDMRMPNMDGAELLSIVKKDYPNVVRMILSGYSEEAQTLKVFESNLVTSYILKPWNNKELMETVDKVFKSEYINISDELIQMLNDIEKLPYSIKIYKELCAMIEKENDIDDISKIIEKDPVITFKILTIVNSSFYGLKTGSIRQALSYLGLNNIKNLIFICYFIDLEKSQYSDELNILWNHLSMTNNIIVKMYKEILKEKFPEELSTAGILHDIGRIILLSCYENKNISLNEFENIINMSVEEEKLIFKNSHDEIGAYILSRLKMPSYIIEAVLYHHNPLDSKVNNKRFLCVLHIADFCSWNIMFHKSKYKLQKDVMDYLNITEQQIYEFMKEYKNSNEKGGEDVYL